MAVSELELELVQSHMAQKPMLHDGSNVGVVLLLHCFHAVFFSFLWPKQLNISLLPISFDG